MTFGREQTLVNSRADSNKWSSHFLKLAAYSPFENSRIPTAWIDSISPICNHAKNCNYMPGIPYITNFIWHSIFRRKYCLSGCFLKLQTTHSIQLIFIFRCHAQKMNQYDHNMPVSTHTHTGQKSIHFTGGQVPRHQPMHHTTLEWLSWGGGEESDKPDVRRGMQFLCFS